jgi:hypothetical protein
MTFAMFRRLFRVASWRCEATVRAKRSLAASSCMPIRSVRIPRWERRTRDRATALVLPAKEAVVKLYEE